MAQNLPVLDISLRKLAADQYEATVELTVPALKPEDRLLDRVVSPCGPFPPLLFMRNEQVASETGNYGVELGKALLSPDAIYSKLDDCRKKSPARMRLFLEPGAIDLASLRWEALSDPKTRAPLFGGDNLRFSRYLTSSDYRRVQLRAKSAIRAFVAISNPKDLAGAEVELSEVNVGDEYERAKQAFKGVITLDPASPPPPGSATLDNIVRQLREGNHDILYLVCHGALIKGQPLLWLENDSGGSDTVNASRLLLELSRLSVLPRLIVLASCQSGGSGRTADVDGAMTAIAPRLAESGVPAVVAMQGNIRVDTIATFMPEFFRQLCADGSIDHAMAIARGKIGVQGDYWAPVLYSRLRENVIWYAPGFAEDAGGYSKFPGLLAVMNQGTCLPILGAGMTERIFGEPGEVARVFAEKNGFPLASYQRDSLPTVAQYLTTTQGDALMRDRLTKRLMRSVLDLHGEKLGLGAKTMDLPALISAAGAMLRQSDRAEPHKVLAAKPFSVYVTANPDRLLEDALEEAKKKPRTEYMRWNEDIPGDLLSDREKDYRPDPQNPLVFHLFGLLTKPSSLVLTEDDYFNYLISVSGALQSVPGIVLSQMVTSTLLMLGFRIEEWSFRVLFRLLILQGSEKRKGLPHVAAQVAPDEDRATKPDQAREYFKGYFQTADIGIYWGRVGDFTADLVKKEKEEEVDDA